MGETAIAAMLDKEEIRELALLYARAIDRRDYDLIQSLYTADATDTHGSTFFPTIDEFVSRLREALPLQRRAGFYVCNHLIAVDGERGEGEVYGISFQLRPDAEGRWIEHQIRSRHLDQYRKEEGRWRFASRVLLIDHHSMAPATGGEPPVAGKDPSYTGLKNRLFLSGPRFT